MSVKPFWAHDRLLLFDEVAHLWLNPDISLTLCLMDVQESCILGPALYAESRIAVLDKWRHNDGLEFQEVRDLRGRQVFDPLCMLFRNFLSLRLAT